MNNKIEFIEDIRRLSKIEPAIRAQMIELDERTAGLTAAEDGYGEVSSYMLYAIENGKLCGKLEYSFNIEGAIAEIIWLNAPGYGNAMLAEFENRVLELMPRCTLCLTCSIDAEERKETVLRRLNFYITHKFTVQDIKYTQPTCTHLTMCKTIERHRQ